MFYKYTCFPASGNALCPIIGGVPYKPCGYGTTAPCYDENAVCNPLGPSRGPLQFFLTTVSFSTSVLVDVFAPRPPLGSVVMLVTITANTSVWVGSWGPSELGGGHFDGGYNVN